MAQADGSRAAGLIREIRRNSGISQAELARRAGMARSVVNAYEHGRREPSVAAMARLAQAAGMELTVALPRGHVDADRAARLLEQVLDLGESLPRRRRGRLGYPPLARLAA
jgi:uncharacterized protein